MPGTTEMTRYPSAFAEWRRDPQGWWERAAESIDWDRRWDRAFDPDSGPYGRWFPGGRLNTCFNCLDRHVAAGRGAQPALIWDSPMAGRIETLSYDTLLARTARMAGALAALGAGRGDRVVIYMPMVPEAVIAMLACARLGAIHSVVFGGSRPTSFRPASRAPSRASSSRRPAASNRAGSCATSRCSTRQSRSPPTNPKPA